MCEPTRLARGRHHSTAEPVDEAAFAMAVSGTHVMRYPDAWLFGTMVGRKGGLGLLVRVLPHEEGLRKAGV